MSLDQKQAGHPLLWSLPAEIEAGQMKTTLNSRPISVELIFFTIAIT